MNLTKVDRPVVGFVATAYALSAVLSLFIGLNGGHESPFIGLGYLSMFIPAISVAVINQIWRGSQQPIGYTRLPTRYIAVALFLIPAAMHAVMLPVAAAVGSLQWQEWSRPAADGLYHTPASRGWGAVTATGLVLRIAVNALAGVFVVSILALFEELGWRAWLLSRLRERIGSRRAVVITSVIWAIWHLPYILAGILHVDGIPKGWTALIAAIGIFGSGLVIGWLWLRTQSIWIVALAHGALNNWGQYAFKFVSSVAQPSDGVVLGAGGLALVAVGSVLLIRTGGSSFEHSTSSLTLPPGSSQLRVSNAVNKCSRPRNGDSGRQ
jgi:membrane protease YdiL (CAAX protease family)